MSNLRTIFIALCVLSASVVNIFTQETPPAPGTPKSVTVPAVQEKKLANGLTVAVIERKNVPLVTIQLLVRGGASADRCVPSKRSLTKVRIEAQERKLVEIDRRLSGSWARKALRACT